MFGLMPLLLKDAADKDAREAFASSVRSFSKNWRTLFKGLLGAFCEVGDDVDDGGDASFDEEDDDDDDENRCCCEEYLQMLAGHDAALMERIDGKGDRDGRRLNKSEVVL
jgi:hypothetical protein